jgi:phospholipase/carboxylesterase
MTIDPHSTGAVLQAGKPLREASLAVILLHGRGGSAEEMLGLGRAFQLPNAAYFAPQASGHTWYPLSFLSPREANEPYLSSALAKVASVVGSIEQSGFDQRRIVIAGFSQGACLSTEFVATNPARYGGLIAFTGGLIGPPGWVTRDQYASEDATLAGMPALFLSGDPDPHVPWARVEESGAVLQAMGAEVATRRFPGRPHTISEDELELARTLLQVAQQ